MSMAMMVRIGNVPSDVEVGEGGAHLEIDVDGSFEPFCLAAGIEALERMQGQDVQRLTGSAP
jgi:hypothetical protein